MRINKNGNAVPVNSIEKAAIAAKFSAADQFGEIHMDQNWRLHVFAAAIELICFGNGFDGSKLGLYFNDGGIIWIDYIDSEDTWQETPVATPSNAAYIIAAYLLEGREDKADKAKSVMDKANEKFNWNKLDVDLSRPASFTIYRNGDEIFRCE